MGTTEEVLEKLRGLDAPKMLAIVDLFGCRENLEACLRGEKKMTLEDVIRLLVDGTGRCIPANLGITCKVCDEDRDYHISQPQWSYSEVRALFVDSFPKGTQFLGLAEFEDTAEAMMKKLMDDPLTANFVRRVHMPWPFPQHVVSDYGRSMQEFFLPVVKQAYKTQFPDREFVNYCDGELDGAISIIPDTGHDKFVARMSEGPGMAWYFPNPMQGFSTFAQRESTKLLLLRGFMLTGAIEPALGFVGYSKEMARDYKTPGYDCPGVSFRSSASSLRFGASNGNLQLGHGARLGCSIKIMYNVKAKLNTNKNETNRTQYY